MNTTTFLVMAIIFGVIVYLAVLFFKKGSATRSICPACGKSYGGNPARCPHCGAKLRWKN